MSYPLDLSSARTRGMKSSRTPESQYERHFLAKSNQELSVSSVIGSSDAFHHKTFNPADEEHSYENFDTGRWRRLGVAFAAQARALFGARRIIELNIFVRLRK
jgi:hypothetical protein